MTAHGELRAEALAFHRKHPEVFERFCSYALDRVRQGFDHYSADAVMHRVRWDLERKGLKIRNNHVAFYARGFHKQHPEHDGFFRTAEQRSLRTTQHEDAKEPWWND